MTIHFFVHTAAEFLADEAKNPFNGVVPNFNLFGVPFTQAWQKVLAAVWGISFVVVAFGAVRAVIELQHAKKGGMQSSVLEHTESAKRSGLALGALAALGIIFGAVVALF
ncbi:hypothetical protein [Amycolatopsis saalfeldensis]|uniref:Uncharacterized protein n=1 Tax=Amycolatopsis saalfeldensis TaxID=394193 RepID=A0A1H8YP77_9PSEU|nr:hypothetical protein [Amycolatopsis saalfeldensis]SEP53987.1 hypothetical protein SAMN04489732_13442 [Amycolatopsis saalfeldensis]